MSAEQSEPLAVDLPGPRERALGQPGRPDPAIGVAAQPELPAGRSEAALARLIRARSLVAGVAPAQIAASIANQCGCSAIRAYRLALGIALADVVAQVRARYEADGRRVPRFSETLLSAYESGQKRPGPEYLHYLCATYLADPADLGFEGRCLCGRSHRPVPHVSAAEALPEHQECKLRAGSAAAASGPALAVAPARPGPRQAGAPVIRLPAASERAGTAIRPAGGDGPAGAVQPGLVASSLVPARLAGGPAIDEDDDELRAMLLRQMSEPGSPVDSRFLGAVDHIRRRMDEALLGGSVSAALLDRWEQSAVGYGRQYMTVPALRLLCDVLLDFAEVRRMCEERQPLEFSERLCRLASQLAGLAGITMLDLGDHRLARAFFRTARSAADETGDRQLRAWVTVREALVPLHYGDPAEALSLAGAAGDLAGRNLCAASVMAPVTEARAGARLAALTDGRHREQLDRARATLDRAHDAIADLPAGQRADAALGYTERQLYFHTGDVLVSLGDWQGAYRAYSQAGQLYAATEVLDCALVALGQARCMLESDELSGALAMGRDILAALPAEHRADVVIQAARALGHDAAARDPRLPGLADYRDALQSA